MMFYTVYAYEIIKIDETPNLQQNSHISCPISIVLDNSIKN